MTDCCATTESDSLTCPSCGTAGPVVGVEPIRPHIPGAADGPWHYCPTAGCATVYYTTGQALAADHLRTRVADKATDKPTPVCYCFSHTTDDLIADRDANEGISTIQTEIKEAVGGGFCACEHLNPSGKCCLPEVRRTLRGTLGGTGV